MPVCTGCKEERPNAVSVKCLAHPLCLPLGSPLLPPPVASVTSGEDPVPGHGSAAMCSLPADASSRDSGHFVCCCEGTGGKRPEPARAFPTGRRCRPRNRSLRAAGRRSSAHAEGLLSPVEVLPPAVPQRSEQNQHRAAAPQLPQGSRESSQRTFTTYKPDTGCPSR